METSDIKFSDIGRWLFGDVPAIFYVELVIRSLFVYFMISIAMKLMGKRLSAELSRSELAATTTLASAGGLILLSPERGLLPALIVVSVVLTIKWILHTINFRNEKFEFLSEGHLSTLLIDGVLQITKMKKARISHEQMFAFLRGAGITHLGEVSRVYLEANGAFSIIKNEEPKAGLPVLPEWDEDIQGDYAWAPEDDTCNHCGNSKEANNQTCTNCKRSDWRKGVRELGG